MSDSFNLLEYFLGCMINYRSYMDGIQRTMGESHAPDQIDEKAWFDIVIRDLNKISVDCGNQIQAEIETK